MTTDCEVTVLMLTFILISAYYLFLESNLTFYADTFYSVAWKGELFTH